MIKIEPVRRQISVRASQARAFDWFTKEMSRWWPRTHSILKSPLKQYVVEPLAGGKWYAVGEDGSTEQTGHVIEWLPPEKLVLAWQLGSDWKFDEALITEVEVRFIAEGQHATRVELEHRNLQRVGERAALMRGMVDAPGGWTAILEAYRASASEDIA